jgi:outer membrane murein-binding lipoprotein Lpp
MGAGDDFEIRFNPWLSRRQTQAFRQEVVQTGSVRVSSLNVSRRMSCAVVICASLVFMGCSSMTKKDDLAAKLAAQEQVDEHMIAAEKALKAGHVDQAMTQLDAAIKADPATKVPWLKRALIHFDAREYGHAITQAQEVLQRDVNDLTAKSILAVSGLRVSAAALDQLRKVNEVSGSTRSEAESVARLIREALGEPILVPAVPVASPSDAVKPAAPAKPGRSNVQRSTSAAARAAAAMPHATSAVPGAATAPSAAPTIRSTAAATAPASGRNNPFGALQ